MSVPSEIAGIEGLQEVGQQYDPCVYFLVKEWIQRLAPELNTVHLGKAINRQRTTVKRQLRLTVMWQARQELESEMGIGKNGPNPDQVVERMDRILAQLAAVAIPAGVTEG